MSEETDTTGTALYCEDGTLHGASEQLWIERTKILNWELADNAPGTFNFLLIE